METPSQAILSRLNTLSSLSIPLIIRQRTEIQYQMIVIATRGIRLRMEVDPLHVWMENSKSHEEMKHVKAVILVRTQSR